MESPVVTLLVDFLDRCVNVAAPLVLGMLLAACVGMLVLGSDWDRDL